MKERPILFSGGMVRAILDGRKTQTRRVIKPQPSKPVGPNHDGLWSDTCDPVTRYFGCPYGQPGDRLYVRETWRINLSGNIWYRADGKSVADGLWKPSIHMPRILSRITLEIESVRVERVQEITPDDCRAEGIGDEFNDIGARYCFGQLWNEINEPRGFGWEVNPWVWAITFRRVK